MPFKPKTGGIINVTLPPDLDAKLSLMAKRMKMPKTKVTRLAIEAFYGDTSVAELLARECEPTPEPVKPPPSDFKTNWIGNPWAQLSEDART